jgi:pSer/pThr/pTyr-binding forkhead associated (FHA) protein
MARLLIKSDGFGNQVLDLRLGVNRFGRSADNDFQIEHPTISAQHCEIVLTAEGLKVRDCNSTNGTFLSSEQIQEAELSAGQVLRLGDVEFLIETTDATVAIPKFEPAQQRPAPPVVLSDGSMVCPRHPEAQATHQCTLCREIMCDGCVHRLRRRGGKVLKLCPICSHPCERIGGEKKKKKSLMEFLNKTVKLTFAHYQKRDR